MSLLQAENVQEVQYNAPTTEHVKIKYVTVPKVGLVQIAAFQIVQALLIVIFMESVTPMVLHLIVPAVKDGVALIVLFSRHVSIIAMVITVLVFMHLKEYRANVMPDGVGQIVHGLLVPKIVQEKDIVILKQVHQFVYVIRIMME